ncbi:hypothetical protein, partial [Mesorhizobium sp.]|uniref:hypothetical protein n=1 Tax=Mesorhizobium sp. TaxID=1871066 RepID=UPI0025FB9892
DTNFSKRFNHIKQNPAEIRRVCQQSEAGLPRLFFVSAGFVPADRNRPLSTIGRKDSDSR